MRWAWVLVCCATVASAGSRGNDSLRFSPAGRRRFTACPAVATTTTTTSTTTTTTSTTTTTIAGGQAATDLRTSTKLIAAYSCKPADLPNPTNDLAASTSCGGTAANCNLTGTNTPTSDTTAGHFIPSDGKTDGAMLCVEASTQYASVAVNPLNFSSSFLLTAFARLANAPSLAQRRIIQHTNSGNADGYMLGVNLQSANQNVEFEVFNATPATLFAESANTLMAVGRLEGIAGLFNTVTPTEKVYVNGTVAGTNTTTFTMTAGVASYRLGGNAANSAWDGDLDENTAWNIAGSEASFTDGFVARLLACGVAGQRCLCSSGTPANYLACTNNSDCGTTALCVCQNGPACAGGSGTCRGWDGGLCAGGANSGLPCNASTASTDCPSSSCTLPTLAACNVAVP